MIKDKLINAKIYYNLSNNIKKGLEWLQKTDLINLTDGKYIIDGESVFASIQTYNTKATADYESHKKYIDIQYIIQGVEKIGVTDINNCSSCLPYDSDKDLEFYKINTREEYLELSQGFFLILYPHDAHKPSITSQEKSLVKKVVVKVAV